MVAIIISVLLIAASLGFGIWSFSLYKKYERKYLHWKREYKRVYDEYLKMWDSGKTEDEK